MASPGLGRSCIHLVSLPVFRDGVLGLGAETEMYPSVQRFVADSVHTFYSVMLSFMGLLLDVWDFSCVLTSCRPRRPRTQQGRRCSRQRSRVFLMSRPFR